MKFKIDSQIFNKFSNLNIGILVCRNIYNKGISEDVIELIREREKEIKSQLDLETLSRNPKINVWREAYRSFGAKPKENKSSVESLYRRTLEGGEIKHINKIVDIYNYISLKYMLPVGGEDLDKIQGDIHLTVAGKNEPFVLLLGDKEARPPHEGEVIYRDKISAICRRFNWREADRTKFTEETRNAILVEEGLFPTQKEDIENVLEEMKKLLVNFCGGDISKFILNKNNSEIEF